MIDPKFPRSLYLVARHLGQNLRARRYVHEVAYGPERLQRTLGSNGIVILHDPSGDNFDAATGVQRNPRMIFTRKTAGLALIFAKSSKAGATHSDHVYDAEKVIDMVVTGLDQAIRGDLGNIWEIGKGRYVAPEEFGASGTEAHNGVAYELQFRLARPVQTLDWDETGQDVFVVESTDEVNTTIAVNGQELAS